MMKKRSWLTFILDNREMFMACSLSAMVASVVTMEFMIWQFSLYDQVGPFKAEKRAAAASEPKSVTVLKPVTPLADTDNASFGLVGNEEENVLLTDADWELGRTVRQVLNLRKVAAKRFPPNEESDQELRAAFATLVTYADQLAQQNRKQEASKESKDAISKDVGNSG